MPGTSKRQSRNALVAIGADHDLAAALSETLRGWQVHRVEPRHDACEATVRSARAGAGAWGQRKAKVVVLGTGAAGRTLAMALADSHPHAIGAVVLRLHHGAQTLDVQRWIERTPFCGTCKILRAAHASGEDAAACDVADLAASIRPFLATLDLDDAFRIAASDLVQIR